MTWFLVVFFLTVNGAELRSGWYPLEQPSLNGCREAAENAIAYLSSMGEVAVAYCLEVTPRGENI